MILASRRRHGVHVVTRMVMLCEGRRGSEGKDAREKAG